MKIRLFALSSPPNPAVYSNCKSNMASRINDREPITSARTNKTPAMQANVGSVGISEIFTQTQRSDDQQLVH